MKPSGTRIPYAPPGSAARTRAPKPPRRAPRRRRVVMVSAAAATLLVSTAVVADRVLAADAAGKIATRVAERAKLPREPDVTIAGFPFLLQLSEGTYPHVRVHATDVPTPRDVTVDAAFDLTDVRKGGDGYKARGVRADFTVPMSELQRQLGPQAQLTADSDRLRITRTVLGLPLTIDARPALKDGKITFTPVSGTFAGTPFDPASRPELSQAFARADRTLPSLPLGLRPTSVTVGGTGLDLHATAADVPLPRD